MVSFGAGFRTWGGPFAASREAETITEAARAAAADLVGAASPDSMVFGQNMTSLTLAFSRALARTWTSGDQIVVTELDHDANRTPWVLAARDGDADVTVVPFDTATYRLDSDRVVEAIGPRTRLVAITYASNALGTVVDLQPIIDAAHDVGALVYVDAVHFAPHGRIDVGRLDPDFLAVSAYKFFGPHTGIVYGRPALLESLDPYKVRPAPSTGPGKWETGTQSFESLAGVTAAVDYLASLGDGHTRPDRLDDAYRRIDAHETMLSERFLGAIADLDHVRLFGIDSVEGRVPTFTVDVDGMTPEAVAAALGDLGIFVWSGHYYAVGVMESLGLLDRGGLVRIGFLHYTTADEVDRLSEALAGLRP